MTENRLGDYLEHIRQAATDAMTFVEGLSKDDFLEDRRTQQAVIIIGDRIAHGYFDINLDVVWDTIQSALPDLLARLPTKP